MRLNSVLIVFGLAAAVCAMPMPAGTDDKGTKPPTGTDLAGGGSAGAPKTETGASSKTATHGDLIKEITDIRFEKGEEKGGHKGSEGAKKKEKGAAAGDKHKERRATPETPAPGADASTTDASKPDASKPDASKPDASKPGASKPDQAHTESKGSATSPDKEKEKKHDVERFLKAVAKRAPKLRWDPEHLEFKWADAGAAAGKGSLEARGPTDKPKENGDKAGKDKGEKEKGKGKEHASYKIDISFKAGNEHYNAHIVKSGEKFTGSIRNGKKMVFSGAA